MHELLDDYLCKKYPKICVNRHNPSSDMCKFWGFEVGNGWFCLIDRLCDRIQYHIDNPPWVYNSSKGLFEEPDKLTIPQVVAQQVKEKFSSLRFYYSGGDEYIRALVDEAEDLSYFICEVCGKMGGSVGQNRTGWIKTTCTKHAIKKDDFTPNYEDLKDVWKQIKKDEKNRKRKENKAQRKWEEKCKGLNQKTS